MSTTDYPAFAIGETMNDRLNGNGYALGATEQGALVGFVYLKELRTDFTDESLDPYYLKPEMQGKYLQFPPEIERAAKQMKSRAGCTVYLGRIEDGLFQAMREM